LTSMNIGTCWIGKGFSDRELESYVDLPSDQTCRALIAFGPLSNSEPEVIADPKRKEPREFLVDSKPDELNGSTLKIIDALRRAPSSINSQPWRVLACDEDLHLYIKSRTFLTRKFLEDLSNMNRIDAGIGLSHLKVAGEHLWGKVEIEEVDHPSKKDLEYIATMVK
ncbi:hypothetical protein K9M06_04505, partial [Candidatus Bipolaricaulota bacterium]|nr:hypothetical protein [Candidatus Bipolaricaulota bacterium]